jgi:hypothetical protein
MTSGTGARDDDGRVRRGWSPVVRVLFLITFGALALAEANPTMGKLWVFLTGVFLGQLYPEKWWTRDRRRSDR